MDYLDYMYLVQKIVLTFAIAKSFYCIFEIHFPGKLIFNTLVRPTLVYKVLATLLTSLAQLHQMVRDQWRKVMAAHEIYIIPLE